MLSPRPVLRRLIYLTAFGLARVLPRTVILFCGYVSACLAWLCDRNGRKQVARNLSLLMPQCNDSSIERMIKKTYTNFGLATAEMLLTPRLTPAHFKHTRIIDPWHQMTELPLSGPLIVVSVHSNWEIMPCILKRLGYFKRCHAIALSHEDPVIDNLFNELREHIGVNSLLLDRAPLETLRTLKAGGILALIADRDYTDHGVLKHVGGGTMKIPVGPAALAIQTQAPILPIFTCRLAARQYAIVFGKYIRPDPTLNKKQQLPILLNQLAHCYERFLQTAPSQWVCFHQAFVESED